MTALDGWRRGQKLWIRVKAFTRLVDWNYLGVSRGIDYRCIWIISLIFQRKRVAKYSSVLCGTVPSSQLFNVTSHWPHRGLLRAVAAQTVGSNLTALGSFGSATWANFSKTDSSVNNMSWCSAAPWYWFQYLLWSSSGKWTWFIQSSSARLLMKIVARLISIKRITWKQSIASPSHGISSMGPTFWGIFLCVFPAGSPMRALTPPSTPQWVGEPSLLN